MPFWRIFNQKEMSGFVIRILSFILLLPALPFTLLLHPWWILTQPLGAYDPFATTVDELTTIMQLPANLSLSIQTGQWWWQL